MKQLHFLFILALSLSITSCDKDRPVKSDLEGDWSLTKITGGIAGLDCSFDKDVIIWSFSNNDLRVLPPSSIPTDCDDNLFTATYEWKVIKRNGNSYLKLDGDHWGQMTFVNDNTIDINGSEIPSGTVNDAISYRIEK